MVKALNIPENLQSPNSKLSMQLRMQFKQMDQSKFILMQEEEQEKHLFLIESWTLFDF